MTDATLALDPADLDSFPLPSREDWLKLVDGVLKGAPYDRRMVTRTLDGLALDALPPRLKDGAPIPGRVAGAPWKIAARIDHTDERQANAQLLEDLDNGADAATLVFAASPLAFGFGLEASIEAISGVLDKVLPELITLRVEIGGFKGRDIALAIARHVEKLDPAKLDIRFGLDPIGDFAALGSSPLDWDTLSTRLGQSVNTLRARGFTKPMLRADGRFHHAAGASDAQELAATLAIAVAYLRTLEAAGLTPEEAAPLIEVTLTADVDQFATLAKPRAFRLLWAAVLDAAGVSAPAPVSIHMETAWRSLTVHDAQVNLLRSTIAAFAAGVGGADSVSVLPFTQAIGLPDAFARRLARNTQLILIEEANLHRVADPGAGAGAIEERTEQLAGTAWELFRGIEKQGGMVEALLSGECQRAIGAVKAARAKDIATRKLPLTGTSEFPLLGETAPAVLAPIKPQSSTVAEGALTTQPLTPYRLAEPFETLRAKAAKSQPAIFLANLGTAADFTGRATFAKALFEAGGIAAPMNAGFADDDALIAAFKDSGAQIACLCSSDAVYAERAESAAQALKAAGAGTLYLAGKVPEIEAVLRESGVNEFVFVGVDLVKTLEGAHAALGLQTATGR